MIEQNLQPGDSAQYVVTSKILCEMELFAELIVAVVCHSTVVRVLVSSKIRRLCHRKLCILNARYSLHDWFNLTIRLFCKYCRCKRGKWRGGVNDSAQSSQLLGQVKFVHLHRAFTDLVQRK